MDRDALKDLMEAFRACPYDRLAARFPGEGGEEFVEFERAGLPAAAAAPQAPAPSGPVAPLPSAAPSAAEETVRAGLVGRFYTTATAGSVPPVRPGARVARGQKIGMIEAMNIEHVIESPVDGRLVATLLDDGAPVEFGAPLFRIAPEVRP